MVDQSGKMKRVQVTCVPSGLSDSNLHLIWRLEHGGGRESHDGKVGKDIGAKAKATNFFLVPTEMSARLRVSVKILVRNGEGFSLESNFFVVRARARPSLKRKMIRFSLVLYSSPAGQTSPNE